ncbi:MAG: thiol oxidoreductase [Saprospiraceae bacterium]|nr:thiol oxidoreductase [Saprospiraceae bacterium]
MLNKIYTVSLFILLIACQEDKEIIPKNFDSILAGGATTIFSSGPDAFTFPLANLDEEGLKHHFLADAAFGQQFVTAPALQFGGVGPLFNQNSCESCHTRNGRGAVPQFEGDPNSGLLLRISIPGVGDLGRIIPVPGFGGQLQNKAIFGAMPEGKISKSDIVDIVEYLDGTQVDLKKPEYSIIEPYVTLPSDVLISARIAPPVHGLGLLEAIPEDKILALADENDANGDSISGKPNMVWNVLGQTSQLGRFGWKAEQPTAVQQAADAAHNDMGLTSAYFPTEHCENQSNCEDGLQNNLDIDEETTNLFGFYFQTLAVPAQRNSDKPEVQNGKRYLKRLNAIFVTHLNILQEYTQYPPSPIKRSIPIPTYYYTIWEKVWQIIDRHFLPTARNGELHHFGGLA